MKKLSIISGILLIALTVFMAFTIYQPVNTVSDPFKVHVTGCDDCSKLRYCVGGGPTVYPGSCDFMAECNPVGAVVQTICVRCGDKAGTATIYCGKTKEVKIEVSQVAATCDCY